MPFFRVYPRVAGLLCVKTCHLQKGLLSLVANLKLKKRKSNINTAAAFAEILCSASISALLGYGRLLDLYHTPERMLCNRFVGSFIPTLSPLSDFGGISDKQPF